MSGNFTSCHVRLSSLEHSDVAASAPTLENSHEAADSRSTDKNGDTSWLAAIEYFFIHIRLSIVYRKG